MSKTETFLNKYVMYALYAVMALSLFGNIRSCGVEKDVSRLKRDTNESLEKLKNSVDSLMRNSYSKEELNIRMSIEGYEVSKRMLYDQNAIVRTVTRPDDRMNEYDQKIKELREKIK